MKDLSWKNKNTLQESRNRKLNKFREAGNTEIAEDICKKLRTEEFSYEVSVSAPVKLLRHADHSDEWVEGTIECTDTNKSIYYISVYDKGDSHKLYFETEEGRDKYISKYCTPKYTITIYQNSGHYYDYVYTRAFKNYENMMRCLKTMKSRADIAEKEGKPYVPDLDALGFHEVESIGD